MRSFLLAPIVLASAIALPGTGCTDLLPGDQAALPPNTDMGASEALPPCDLPEAERGAMEVSVDGDVTPGAEGTVDWTCGNTFRLTGPTFVTSGTELRIQSGTRILADAGAYLYARVGARLTAVGEASDPIVFTSSNAVGERRRNDWRGVFLAGSAPHNFGTPYAPTDAPTGFARVPSGNDPSWDCGTLRYVRVEFAGVANNESQTDPAAALTFIGCGSQTDVEFVQTHSTEDGIGLVGGAFIARHVVSSLYQDDGIEWTGGFGPNGSGGFQFLVTLGNFQSENGIRGNNNESLIRAIPRSGPFIANLTAAALSGGLTNSERGVQFGIGSRGVVANSVFTHLGRGMDVDFVPDDFTSVLEPSVSGSIFVVNSVDPEANITAPFPDGPVGSDATPVPESPDNDGGFDEYARIGINPSFRNRGANPASPDAQLPLASCCEAGMPLNFVPTQDASFGMRAPARAGFEATEYAGAFVNGDPEPWDAEWTDYPES